MRFLVAGMMMAILPLVASAQTADRQALIQQLTQQAAKLQAQLDQLRQASSSPPSPLAQQLTGGSAEFLKLLQTKIAQPQSAASSPANVHVSPENQSDNEPPPATVSFDRNLSFGMRNDADVSNLQEFLTDQGFYNNTISGNFFILTRNAVKKFQEAHGIKPSGYFGSVTRVLANNILGGNVLGGNGIHPQLHQTNGSLTIDPASATLKTGERISLKAMFAPPRPACLDNSTHPCRVPERAPYEVEVSFISSDSSVASVDAIIRECASPPPGITSPCSPQYFVRGITAGSATISASYASGEGTFTAKMKSYASGEGTFTAKMNVTVAGQFSSQGILSIVPASANLAIGGQIGVQAYYQQPLPACLHNNPPCALGMMEPSPQPVFALFASDNPNVAAVDKIEDKTCDPPRMCPVSVSHYAVRGVSAGSAVITASFSSNAAETLTATIKVAVSATTTAGIR